MPPTRTAILLRNKVIRSLRGQGFSVNGHIAPDLTNKTQLKKIQNASRKEQISFQKNYLIKQLPTVEKYLVNGWDVNPNEIDLELRVVEEGSIEEKLYRWWNLSWWSVPYQKPYGRQMRFLIWDKAHNAPFGLIGLQSPVLKMSVRDNYLKIPPAELDFWVNKSMQAQRLGALPPYNQIIGGKMVALALSSNEMRDEYSKKYAKRKTVLLQRELDSDLLFITTTSAFGRSSIYNRLKYNEEKVAISLGYTKGSGSFHITQKLYSEIQTFLRRRRIDTNTTFGYGPSRKVKLLDIALSLLDLKDFHYHNITREFFLFPSVRNLNEVISQEQSPDFYDRPFSSLATFWKNRWAIPRFHRENGWVDFCAESYLNQIKTEVSNGRK